MIRRLGTGGRLERGMAAAGAGKTAALQPLVAAWREQGREVYGASLAWRQADDMTDAGIAQRNVKAFSVLIEAAKAGDDQTRSQLRRRGRRVGAARHAPGLGVAAAARAARLSDRGTRRRKQCSSIEAGAIIELSRRALGAEQVPEIMTTVRQQTEREREIVGLFREGRAKRRWT